MEEEIMDPADLNKNPKIIKDAQSEIEKIDILVCGQCHMVFHFIEQFQDHRDMGNCSGVSSLRENNLNESKAHVWAFLLWKCAQNLLKSENSWSIYQRWCKMDQQFKDAWVTAGKHVQIYTKMSVAKMQEIRTKNAASSKDQKKILDDDFLEEGEINPLGDSEDVSDADSEVDTDEEAQKELNRLRQNKNNNGTTDGGKSDEEKDEVQDALKKIHMASGISVTVPGQKKPEKLSRNAKRTDKVNATVKEAMVEKILAKRFNPRKKLHEYLIKWDGCPHEQNTWEPPGHLETCKQLVDGFERNLARQKEAKAAAQAALNKQKASHIAKLPGPSGTLMSSSGRPQRTSKQKAMDQVKQWCGNISDRDDDLGLKRRMDDDDDSDDDFAEKKIKMELDSGSEDEWQADENDLDRHTVGRPKVVQKTTSLLNGIAKKQQPMTAVEVARSIGLASPDRPQSTSPPVFLANNKGVVKVYKNQMPNLSTGVYIMSKKDGIVKLEQSSNVVTSSPNSTNIIRVQKTSTPTTTTSNSNIMRVQSKIGQTQVRMVPKPSTTAASSAAAAAAAANAESNVRLSPGMSRTNIITRIKSVRSNNSAKQQTPGRMQSQQQPKERLQAQRMQIGTPQLKLMRNQTPMSARGGNKAPEKSSPPKIEHGPEATDAKSDTSDEDYDLFPKDPILPEPDSPPREFTLDPMTGMIIGQAEGEPEPMPQEEQPVEQQHEIEKSTDEAQPDLASTTDMPSMPSLSALTEEAPEQAQEEAQEAEQQQEQEGGETHETLGETHTTITLPETGEPIMITGEDGVVYQIAGQNEEGQTLLVAQGADGQQQCVYVTTTEDAQGGDGTVLTLDSAVADAIGNVEGHVVEGDEHVSTMEQITVNTQMDDDDNSQVVAQLVKAELPSPGGTRKVVLLLPDGNLLMTEVDAEQYAALELDK